jgi:hypothetical protein
MTLLVPKFDPLVADTYVHKGRSDAPPVFLNCCRLIAHYTARISLLDPASQAPLSSDYNIFVRNPSLLFWSEILQTILQDKYGGFLSQFQGFLEAILRSVQATVASTYAPAFFTSAFLTSLYSVESWMVSPHIALSSVPPRSFHVYRLIRSLPAYADYGLLLPANGLTLLEAKHLGLLTYYLFAMVDLPDTLQDTHFRKSILGSRLKAWCVLPDNPNVHSIWSQYPGQATYQWFLSLQHLLLIVMSWIKWLRFHPSRGFLEAYDVNNRKHLLLDNHIPSPIPDRNDSVLQVLQQFDLSFQNRWYQNTSFDSVWSSPLPAAHFQSAPSVPYHPNPALTGIEQGAVKRQKKLSGAKDLLPDFINNTPLVEAVVPFQSNKPFAMQLLTRLNHVKFPKFQAPCGELTMCFLSAFAPPHNQCSLRRCVV